MDKRRTRSNLVRAEVNTHTQRGEKKTQLIISMTFILSIDNVSDPVEA